MPAVRTCADVQPTVGAFLDGMGDGTDGERPEEHAGEVDTRRHLRAVGEAGEADGES